MSLRNIIIEFIQDHGYSVYPSLYIRIWKENDSYGERLYIYPHRANELEVGYWDDGSAPFETQFIPLSDPNCFNKLLKILDVALGKNNYKENTNA